MAEGDGGKFGRGWGKEESASLLWILITLFLKAWFTKINSPIKNNLKRELHVFPLLFDNSSSNKSTSHIIAIPRHNLEDSMNSLQPNPNIPILHLHINKMNTVHI